MLSVGSMAFVLLGHHPMHAVTPRVVAIAVRIAMTVWITNFHFSLFIVLVF